MQHMKIFNIIFAGLFVVSAGLQFNDPDPWLWIPIYLYGAVLCWFAFRGRYYTRAMLVGIGAYLVYAVYLVFTKNGVIDWATEHHAESLVQTMKAEKPWIEDTREFGGLLILIVALGIDYVYARRRKLGMKNEE